MKDFFRRHGHGGLLITEDWNSFPALPVRLFREVSAFMLVRRYTWDRLSSFKAFFDDGSPEISLPSSKLFGISAFLRASISILGELVHVLSAAYAAS